LTDKVDFPGNGDSTICCSFARVCIIYIDSAASAVPLSRKSGSFWISEFCPLRGCGASSKKPWL